MLPVLQHIAVWADVHKYAHKLVCVLTTVTSQQAGFRLIIDLVIIVYICRWPK